MTKKYILKPGNHQFAPGSHPIHNNENLDDEDAEWYLKAYPHIANLFEQIPRANELVEIKLLRDIELLNQAASLQPELQSVQSPSPTGEVPAQLVKSVLKSAKSKYK